MDDAVTTTDYTLERWTYEGPYRSSPDKLAHAWRDDTGVGRWFDKNIVRMVRPGAIYDVHVTRDAEGRSSVAMGDGSKGPLYIGMIDDEAHLALLQAKSRAEEAAVRVVKQAKADMGRDAVAEILALLKAEYQRRNRTGRRALLAVVLEEMSN